MTVAPLDFVPTVPELVQRAADRFGARDYIVTPDRSLTFAAADAQSRRLAKRLLESGVGKGTRVGLLFPQGPDFVVAFLALTRIGALAVPLSTFLRSPELHRAVRHADLHAVIAPRVLLGRDTGELVESTWAELAATAGPELFLAQAPYLRRIWICGRNDRRWVTPIPEFSELQDESRISDAHLDHVESEVTPADLMVMVQTSGATAEPKAVVHTHGAQVRHSWTLAQLAGMTEATRTFSTTPFFWVGGLTVTLLTHLHVGATVITIERMQTRAMVDLIHATNPDRVLGWTLVDRITSDPAFADQDLSWLVELQPPAMAHPGKRHGSFGMTETGGPHTAAPQSVNVVDLPERLRGSFGPPVPAVQHRIIDPETGSAVPDGVEGEICVRGESLMDGIYKRERRATFDADGWYHTGDRGMFREGFLFFAGRSTDMIKTGGANVSPREVELAVQSLPGVKVAFVVGLPDAARGDVVGCLVCPEPGHVVDPETITVQLRDRLSSFKVPRSMVVVPYDEAPWTPSGKISKAGIVELLSGSARGETMEGRGRASGTE
jgi:acyl-CoA synthetase (AMP-forming)/AMP-acid ligase II